MTGRTEYLLELERHWGYFREAGFVEQVTYYAPVMDATTGALSWPTGIACDAIRDGNGVRKEERTTPGGKVIVQAMDWHVRRSQSGEVQGRGKLVDADGVTWLIDPDLTDAGDKTDEQVTTVKL